MYVGGIYGRVDHAARIEAGEARRRSTDAKREIEELEDRLERATLVSEAVWSLVGEKLGLTADDLLDRVNAIDLSDGKLDGRVRRPAVECAKCRRISARRFRVCVYCGHPLETDPFA